MRKRLPRGCYSFLMNWYGFSDWEISKHPHRERDGEGKWKQALSASKIAWCDFGRQPREDVPLPPSLDCGRCATVGSLLWLPMLPAPWAPQRVLRCIYGEESSYQKDSMWLNIAKHILLAKPETSTWSHLRLEDGRTDAVDRSHPDPVLRTSALSSSFCPSSQPSPRVPWVTDEGSVPQRPGLLCRGRDLRQSLYLQNLDERASPLNYLENCLNFLFHFCWTSPGLWLIVSSLTGPLPGDSHRAISKKPLCRLCSFI